MTEQDPRETFQADQAEAANVYQAREEEVHAVQVRSAEAQARGAEAVAARLEAQGRLLDTSAAMLSVMGLVAMLHALKRLVTR